MSIETSASIANLMPALLRFQGSVEGVRRDSKNDHFRNRYASLESVIDTARPHLQENGLVFCQAPGRVVDGCIEVTTRITHAESGEWQQSTMHVPMGKRDPQGAGSALTYGQRYSLMAALGLPPTDDDGEAAIDRRNERQEPQGRVVDQNRVIADTMVTAIKTARARADLAEWQAKQQEKIDDLDDVNRERVLSEARQKWKALPKEAA